MPGSLTLVRARALASAGRMAWFQADFATAQAQLQEALALFRQENDTGGTLEAISGLVLVLTRQGAIDEATALLEEAQRLLHSIANHREILPVLAGLARAAAFMVTRESLTMARPWSEESAELAREAGDKRSLAWALDGVGICSYFLGEMKGARAALEEGTPLFEELGDLWGVAFERWLLGNVALYEGKRDEALALHTQAITAQTHDNSRQGLPYMLDSFAFLAIEEGQSERAVRLLGAAQAASDRYNNIQQPLYRGVYDKYVARLRPLLEALQWDVLWSEGYALTTEDAIAFAVRG